MKGKILMVLETIITVDTEHYKADTIEGVVEELKQYERNGELDVNLLMDSYETDIRFEVIKE